MSEEEEKAKAKAKQRQHDESFRALFSNAKLVRSLLAGFVDERLLEGLDFEAAYQLRLQRGPVPLCSHER
jgi:hypothetical protein